MLRPVHRVMNVCFLNMPIEYYSPSSGGAISTIIAETTRELSRVGHEVTVITWSDDTGHHAAGHVQSMGTRRRGTALARILDRVCHRAFRKAPLAHLRYRRAATAALRGIDRDLDAVIIFNDYDSPRWLRRATRTARIIVWLQNDQPVPGLPELFERDIDTVLACSDYIARAAVVRGVPVGKVTVAASGVDHQTFYPRDEWLEPSAPLRVLCVGRLDPNKGHDIAISIVAAVRHDGHAVEVTLAGARWWYGEPGQPTEYERRLLKGLEEISGTYVGLVSRPDIPALIRSHDVAFVLSRSNEPFGLVVLEAMASGCAVIASNRGGLPQACGGAAILIDPDDVLAGTAALEELVANHDLLVERKVASRERALAAPWRITASIVADACRPIVPNVTEPVT